MTYKIFSKELWNHIEETLDQVLLQDPNPVAAFDADGTLWDTDLGEAFFNHIIDHQLVPLPEEPWAFYQNMKKNSAGPGSAYLWLAQILKGIAIEKVSDWSRQALIAQDPVPYFPEQKKLIEFFQSKGVSVYIVTASVKWAVDAGAEIIGVPANNVLGVETVLVNGQVTEKQKGVITYKEGKAQSLLEKTGGKKPFFCSGNTMGDWDLLNIASHIKLAVSAAHPDDKLFRTEQEFLEKAKKADWFTHRFV